MAIHEKSADGCLGRQPPWVSYRYMTEEMQEQFKAFSQARKLWHGAKVATQQDLVGPFLVRAVEKYLKNDGHFAFVTPLAVLSRSQYEGLRRGNWNHGVFGEFTEVWDLAEVRPKNDLFPVPCAVVFGVKHLREESKNKRQLTDFQVQNSSSKVYETNRGGERLPRR